jgi:hypothetical protein
MPSVTFAAFRKWLDAWLDRPWPVLRAIGHAVVVARQRFEAFDDWLDAWAARNWPVLSAIGFMISFAVFFGGVMLAAFRSGLANSVGALCGPVCLATPGFAHVAAAMWGAAAILFVKLYVTCAAAVERWFVDTLFYRPAPLMPKGGIRWAVVVFNLTGVALFVALIAFELIFKSTTTNAFFALGKAFEMSVESHTTNAPFVFLFGWICGGRRVLGFFWPQRPARWGLTLDQHGPARAGAANG